MAVPRRPVRPASVVPTPPAPVPRPAPAAVPRADAHASSPSLAYGAAVAASGFATLAALVLGLGSEPGVFAPFFVALVAIALRYGVGPGLVTIATSVVAAYVWLLAPMVELAFDPTALRSLAIYRLAVFATAGICITGLTEMHRRALQQLERSRRQLRAFAADDEVGMQVIDGHGRISWADPATPRLLGYDAADYIGRPFADFHSDPAVAIDVLALLASGNPVENVPATLVRKDGGTQEVLLNSNTLLGDDSAGFLIAVLPLAPPAAAVDGKLAVSFLLERRRRAAAAKHAERPNAERA
ncbi:MAG: PAS domain-containing protein [Candidatus Binatia bacterium]